MLVLGQIAMTIHLLYYALVDGGAKESGSPVDTDSEHDWLKDNGYELVYEGAWSSKDDVQNREKGDVIIWGYER